MSAPLAFTPQTQADFASALLGFAYSDPQVSAALLPTDLSVGSLERAEVESIALLLEEGDQRVAYAIVGAISQACMNAFGFSLLPPTAAVGGIVASCFAAPLADIPIPSGWQVQGGNGITYQTTAAGVLAAGDLTSAVIPVLALTAGAVGNAAANTLNTAISPLAGVDIVTNPNPTVGGQDQETADAQAARFAQYIRTVPRGSTDALEFAALSTSPAVVAALAVEPFLLDPVPAGVPFAGLVWLFVDDGTSLSLADSGLYTPISQLVNGYTDPSGKRVPGFKAAGCQVQILKVSLVQVYLRVDCLVSPEGAGRWGALQANLLSAAQTYFQQLRIGDPVSYQNLVTALTDSDVDLLQANVYLWPAASDGTETPPAYGASMGGSADGISFLGDAVGTRASLFQGTAPGPLGTVTYPEFRLV